MRPQQTLSLTEARRLAVSAQLLSAPRPTDVLAVVRHLTGLQMDPTASIARAERLVLWSRLGPYDVKELDRLIYTDRELFEYYAFILPMEDLPIHRHKMRRYATATTPASRASRQAWVKKNQAFRRYVLRELRQRGPLASRALEDRAAVAIAGDGWNDGRSLTRMLEILWTSGEIVVAGRDGNVRLWDIADRYYPRAAKRMSEPAVARAILERQLKARGPSRVTQFGYTFDDRPPGWRRALDELIAEGEIVPTKVEGTPGTWYVHRDTLGVPFAPRTTFLAPFDRLIHNRVRTEELFGFYYRIEIYVPPALRKYGYYVLPILHGERLVGRIDPVFDRSTRRLDVKGIWAEPGAPADAGPGIADALGELAAWVGAEEIRFVKQTPKSWRDALKPVSASTRGRSRAADPKPKARPAAPRTPRGSRSTAASR